MQAPKYINTNIIFQKNGQHTKEIHEKKLQSIKSRKSGIPKFNSSNSSTNLKHRWNSVSNSKNYIVRVEEIKYQNLKLLEKLLDISLKPQNPSFLNNFPIRSLNNIARKKENEKIAFENSKIAQRIANKSPSIHLKDFKNDYKVHALTKKRISRIHVLARRNTGKKNDNSLPGDEGRFGKNCESKTPDKFVSPCLREVIGSDEVVQDEIQTEKNN